ncbi:MAG: exosortase/archaeosortase family protein [Dysgonomonas sp.]|nr:exosortase/archaeosortase family protein [Dysgonomonas sp.]
MIDVIKAKFRSFLNFIAPVKGIVFFLFLFLLFELIWKLSVSIGENGEQFIVLGHNLTGFIYPICELDARIVYWIIHDLMNYETFNIDGIVVYFDNSLKMQIIMGCTSIKQWLMFSFIMIFYYGPWKKKLVFIPASLLFLSFINIVRLVVSSFLIKDGFPEWFIPMNELLNGAKWNDSPAAYWQFYRDWYHFFHDGFFKWVYYDGIMFLIWLFWQEKINLPYQRLKNNR